MSIKIPKIYWFILAYAVTLVLYWPAMSGTPIWDDNFFWFDDHNMKLPYWEFWRGFVWPASVSAQKFMLELFDRKYIWYHSINLGLHFLNSYLVYKLARILRFRFAFLFFLLFLLHPAAVITTAWMIQIKTLLCFLFAMLSLLTFMKGNKNTKWMIVSWICFGISVLSKSASITLPVILAFISFRTYRFSKVHLLIPFFLLSLFGAWKLLGSKLANEASEKAAVATQMKEIPQPVKPKIVAPPVKPIEKTEVKKELKKKKKKLKKSLQPPPPAPPIMEPQPPAPPKKSPVQIGLIAQTLNYYFWQAPVPANNIPVKGQNYEHAGYMEWTHIIFLLILVIALWNDVGIYYLAASHLLLLPFLGIVPAPYMNVTWVSDQHLYLVLPAFIALWMRLAEKVNWKYVIVLPSLFVVFFAWKTWKTVPLFQNDIVFYEACTDYDPYNVPMTYNLVLAYFHKGENNKAYQLAEYTVERGMNDSIIKENPYYPLMGQMYLYLKSVMNNEN